MTSVLGPYGAPFRKISGALYVTSAALVVLPVIDLVSTLMPLAPAATKWRFAPDSMFTGTLLTPLLGAAIAMIVAGLMNHRFVLRWIGIISLFAGVALLGISALLALDVVGLRAGAESDASLAIVLAGVRALIKNLVVAGSLFYIGLACRSASGAMEPPRAETPMAPIVGAPRR